MTKPNDQIPESETVWRLLIGNWNLSEFGYRDNNRNEIDCILEDVQLKALEIKSARTFSDSFTKGLDFLIKHANLQPDHAYVVYGGDDSFQYKEKKVLSWRSLNEV